MTSDQYNTSRSCPLEYGGRSSFMHYGLHWIIFLCVFISEVLRFLETLKTLKLILLWLNTVPNKFKFFISYLHILRQDIRLSYLDLDIS